MYASERQLARLRLAYLSSVLSQEIGAFDTDLTSGKIISGVSNHMSVIQDAIGEKVYIYTIYISNMQVLPIYMFDLPNQLLIYIYITMK